MQHFVLHIVKYSAKHNNVQIVFGLGLQYLESFLPKFGFREYTDFYLYFTSKGSLLPCTDFNA